PRFFSQALFSSAASLAHPWPHQNQNTRMASDSRIHAITAGRAKGFLLAIANGFRRGSSFGSRAGVRHPACLYVAKNHTHGKLNSERGLYRGTNCFCLTTPVPSFTVIH